MIHRNPQASDRTGNAISNIIGSDFGPASLTKAKEGAFNTLPSIVRYK